jgi:hypothetical protein
MMNQRGHSVHVEEAGRPTSICSSEPVEVIFCSLIKPLPYRRLHVS